MILPCLVVFSVVLIGDAVAGSQTLAEAVEEVSEGQPPGGVVVYEAETSDDGGLQDWVTGGKKRVCWVSASAAAEISSIYRTSWITVLNVRVLVVYDASAERLRQILGDRHCTFVRVRRTFFLPFDPHLS